MSLTATTLAAACTAGATSLNVSSATGFLKGNKVQVDSEKFLITDAPTGTFVPVVGGQDGTRSVAHNLGAYAVTGTGSEFPYQDADRIYTYGATTGAITVAGGVHRLANATAGAYTLAAPTRDTEGIKLTLIAVAAIGYTVTLGSGYWNGTASNNVATWAGAIGDCLEIMSIGGSWCVVNNKNITLGT